MRNFITLVSALVALFFSSSEVKSQSALLTYKSCKNKMSGSKYLFHFSTDFNSETDLCIALRDNQGRTLNLVCRGVYGSSSDPYNVIFSAREFCDEWSYIEVEESRSRRSDIGVFLFNESFYLESDVPLCPIGSCLRMKKN